jgi:hypothetical protein
VAKSDTQRAAIKSISDSLELEIKSDTWKEQTFGMVNPLGASMVIYGLRTELHKIGMEALKD